MTDQAQRRFIRPYDVETLRFPWGSIKWMSDPTRTGTSTMAVGVVVLRPGDGHSRHNHPGSDETLYVISGEGLQMVEDDDGVPIERPVRPGDMIFIPEGVYHGTRNTGWEPMRILAIYAPSGPEALLREQPDCEILPPGIAP